MNKLTPSGLLTSLFLAVFPAAASAQTAQVAVGPHAGARELRLNQGFLPINGITKIEAGGGGITLAGANAGLGYFISDNVELGATLNLLVVIGTGDGDTVVSPGVSPFVRFVTGPAHLRYYGELSVLYQPFLGSSNTVHFFGGGVEAGLEVAIRESWSFRVGPTYRYLLAAGANGNGNLEFAGSGFHAFGLNWGIAAYF